MHAPGPKVGLHHKGKINSPLPQAEPGVAALLNGRESQRCFPRVVATNPDALWELDRSSADR